MKYLKLTTEQAKNILTAYANCSNCNDCILKGPGYRCSYLVESAEHHMQALKNKKAKESNK